MMVDFFTINWKHALVEKSLLEWSGYFLLLIQFINIVLATEL